MIKESDRSVLNKRAIYFLNKMASELESSNYRLLEFNTNWATIDDTETGSTFLSFKRLCISIEPVDEVA